MAESTARQMRGIRIGLPYPQDVGGNYLFPSRNRHTFVREYRIMNVLSPLWGTGCMLSRGSSEEYLASSGSLNEHAHI